MGFQRFFLFNKHDCPFKWAGVELEDNYSGNLKNRTLIIWISHKRNFARGYFSLFGFVRIRLIFRSLSSLILLIRNQNHPIRHYKSTYHCLRKAYQCANKAKRDLVNRKRSVSRIIDNDCNMGPGKGEGCFGRHSAHSSMSHRSN